MKALKLCVFLKTLEVLQDACIEQKMG